MAQQPGSQNGTLIFDFGKKKPKQVDTLQRQTPINDDETKPARKVSRTDTTIKIKRPDYYDFKRDGIFSALFHAGINLCQVDGDTQYGYFYLGGEAGIGALARFHKYLSASLELNYSMKGAGSFLLNKLQTAEYYLLRWDYVEAPVALNGHYRWLMLSAGLAPGYMVYYHENDDGQIDHSPLGPPKKFDLPAFGGIYFIIKKRYAINWKFSYSLLKIRDPYPATRVNGEYNNYMTLRFVYILTGKKK